jgi:hypothetical protein
MAGLQQPTSKSCAIGKCIVKIEGSLKELNYSILGTTENLGLGIARSLGDKRYTYPKNSL